MRAVTYADIIAAARRLWALEESERSALMSLSLSRAHAADLYRKRTGRVHPFWGNGTLAGYFGSAGPLAPAPPLIAPGFMEALFQALHSILEWRSRQR
ncbi:MAG: hypothetical protein WBA91_09395 [Paracoccaceae bacterium]